MPLSDEDVREILRIIDESELDELRIETEGFSLHVRKGRGAGVDPAPPSAEPPRPRAEPSPPPIAPPPNERPEQGPEHDGLLAIESPMLGTFYRAEAPGAAPFVEVGSRVEADTIVCIIEVMKMMNSIPAGTSGEIVDVCQENGDLVEYGEPLFRVRPA
jgi:acetyl-CoA carboxylase biotin carboxyl carrier protein